MKKILTFLAFALLCMACSTKADFDSSIKFLYDNMPLPDRTTYSEEFWAANVRKTLEVREKMNWNVPEREFLHFVLPLRVNNETLDDFRTLYADELCERVKGMSMYDAVLEINHWCHEMATYQPSDARTSSPLATIRKGYGRCGEESVLGVAALRAAGIPARQVYTPRWAHTDDNHAWVEAFVDGKWYFLGACEPEAKLNMGWFNAPVSRALLLHTRAFGDYRGPEGVISKTKVYTEINVTENYVPVRESVVKVVDRQGAAVQGASVEFKIYNYGEFYTVAKYIADESGLVSLETGLGDLLAWASSGEEFGVAKVTGDTCTLVLEHKFGDSFGLDFDMIPPPENPIPTDATEEEIARCKVRFDKENETRDAREKGNGKVTDGFLADNAGKPAAEAILNSLSAKDWNDVTREVLDDALAHCGETFNQYRDCPRIELEYLLPYFSEIGKGVELAAPQAVVSWVADNIAVDDAANPQHLRIPPVTVWRTKLSDTPSRNIFFVALCRAKGFEARIDPVTGKTQYLDGGVWIDVNFGSQISKVAPQGSLMLCYTPTASVKEPEYYRHFTLSEVREGSAGLLSFDEGADLTLRTLFGKPIAVDAGYYMLTSGSRMADGSVLAHLEFFNVKENECAEMPLEIRSTQDKISVIGSFYADPFLPLTGRGYFLMAVTGYKDEPTNHAIRQLNEIAASLNEWGRPCLIFGKARPSGFENEVYGGEDNDGSKLETLASGCKSDSKTLPVIAVCDSFGRIVYFSQGYNTSLGEELKRVVNQL